MTINRKTVRDAVSLLFQQELVGEGKIAQVLYGYNVALINESPTIVVSSSSSQRAIKVIDASVPWETIFVLDVTDFVAYAIENTAWNEEAVEDMLDLIDAAIADVISNHHVFFIDGIGDTFLDLVDEPSEINTDTERKMMLETRMVSVTCKG